MSTLTWNPMDPVSSSEFNISDLDRIADVDRKHRAVAEFLESRQYDALLLEKASNFAWFTSGGDCTRAGSPDTTAALFITPKARVVVTSNVDSAQLFDREITGLGFQLKERPWHEPRQALIEDLCRGRSVASDTGVGETTDVGDQVAGMRIPLSNIECQRLKELGIAVAHAVEATARNCHKGQSEAETAGELSHRLIRHRIIPELVQVRTDGRERRYPHWAYGDDCVENVCSISAVGRRHGLCLGASRTVCFGKPTETLRDGHYRSMLIQATGMYFTQPNWELFEIWNRIRRIYEKLGCDEQWKHSGQAEIIGYDLNERSIVPESQFRVTPKMAVYWHPSIGAGITGDSILVGDNGVELLTPMEAWPRLKIQVKGTTIYRPDFLRK